ncbi:MAG: hypothetical protein IPL61_35225 [Myxococcales bacterium]|nr:hypothetical protein [Myxococcales bacterium]
MTARATLARVAGVAVALAACQTQPGPDLQVLTETARPRWSDGLPRTSAIFDGTTVRLRGARGETLGLEIVRTARAPVDVTVAIDGVDVHGFTVDHARVDSPSTSLYGRSRGPGGYPDRLTPVVGPIATPRMAYVDVAIAADAAVGLHRGTLAVDDTRYAIELTVEPLTLPPLDRAPWVWAYYDAREIKRVTGATYDDVVLAAERRYAALFRSYGVIASPELTADSWPLRRDLIAGLRYVPVLLPREPDALAAEVAGWIERTAGAGVVPFAIPVDEPRTADAEAAVRDLSARVRAAGGGPGRFLYAVTHGPSPALGDAIDVYVASDAVRRGVAPPAQAWTYNGAPGWAGAMVVDAAHDGTLRSWGWLGFAYDLPIWYVWDALYWRDRHNRGRDQAPEHDLARAPITFDDGEDHGALDGVLAYPGPLPSLRLAQLRRGLTDRLLLEAYAARAGRPAALALVRELIPTAGPPRWPADDAAWERVRLRLLDAAVAAAH